LKAAEYGIGAIMTGQSFRPRAWRLSLWHVLIPLGLGVFLHGAIANDAARISGAPSFLEGFEHLDRKWWEIANGWSNNDEQGCVWSASNVKVVGKKVSLVLNNRRGNGKDFSCAELQTRERYGHGTYEARMRPAAGAGIVSAFFSYAGPPHGTDQSQERWISFDFVGQDLKNLHLGFYSAGGRAHRHKVSLAFDPSEAMNDYAFQWTPQVLRWFVNGQLVHSVDIGPAERKSKLPAKVFVSLRNGIGDQQVAWLGQFEYDGRPLLTTYEYIAFTELGAPCRFPTSVVCTQGRSE
jgi:endo-1,3-1,4-beta-glycanase ExoK